MSEYLENEAKGICDDYHDIPTPIVNRVGEVTGLTQTLPSQIFRLL